MKNKGVIIGLLVIFSLICAYNIAITGYRLWIERDLTSQSPADRDKWMRDESNVESFKFATERSLSLGLDLQGGMYVTMRIAVDDILKGIAGRSVDEKFLKALREAQKESGTSDKAFVDIFYKALKKEDPNVKMASYFAGSFPNELSYSSKDEDVVKVLKRETDGAVKRSFEIIRTRIDRFGVTSPNLQKIPGTEKILLELPGVRDADRVRKLLRGTANLEFWPTYTYQEVKPYLDQYNNKFKGKGDTAKAATDTTKAKDAKKEEAKDAPKDAKTETEKVADAKDAKKDAKADTGKPKAEEPKVAEAEKGGKDPVGVALDKYLKPPKSEMSGGYPEMGKALITDTAEINQILNDPVFQRTMPSDLAFYWTAKPNEKEDKNSLSLIAIKSNREKKAPLDGKVIESTSVDQDQNNQIAVNMTMNTDGKKIWRAMTSEYIGKCIAIVLDGMVYTYPTVQSVISGGNSQITGNFTREEADDLANILKAGKMPAPARIDGEEIVGPSLGEATIQWGTISFILSFICIMLFVQLYYRSSGTIANIALLCNLFFILGISSSLQIVLTLPGIAGMILTIAMAVDANVLSYERIREELDAGKSVKGAIMSGFQNALSAIIDGNITIFLAGAILFTFGIGPIRGFAVTLMIGILTTLVTGLIITRLLLEYATRNQESMTNISFGTTAVREYFQKKNFQFIFNRRNYYYITGLIGALCLASILTFGFKLGLDFKGGRQYLVELPTAIEVGKATDDLTKAFEGATCLIKSVGQAEGQKTRVLISTSYLVDQQDADEKVKQAVVKGLSPSCPTINMDSIVKSSKIGPSVAEDIKKSALLSVIACLLVMFSYIFLRFQYWEYGIGAVVSLGFNVLVTLGLFSILGKLDFLPFSVEIDQNFIAAILTIVGYTINDTVVVFDRIRENTQENTENKSLEHVFNGSINDTLARTIITAAATLITCTILFFLGGDVLKGFMMALFCGIVVGTFSSIFVATPITLDLINYLRSSAGKAAPTPDVPSDKKATA